MSDPEVPVAYFLGAGAAAVSNVPLIDEFRNAAERIGEANEFLTEERRELFKYGLEIWDHWGPRLNVEELYVLADLKGRVWGPINNRQDELRAIQFMIAETIERCSTDAGQASHDSFVQVVHNHPGACIVSSNWDITIDNALLRAGIDVNYANGASPLFAFQMPQAAENGPRFLKLHGSLNWGQCPNESCAITAFQEEKVAAAAFLENGFRCGACGNSGLKPAFIPPLAQKMETAQEEFVNIWQQAFQQLRYARQVAVVGYSLPRTDTQVEMLLFDAIGRKDSKVKEVHVVGPPSKERDSRFARLARKVARPVAWRTHDKKYETWVEDGCSLQSGRALPIEE